MSTESSSTVTFSRGPASTPGKTSFYLETETTVPFTPEEVFPFFADAGNLERITPPWLHFKILTPQPIQMEVGALIDYSIRLHGIPITWKTRIAAWEPNERFIDEQLRGPYLVWIHEHTFEAVENGTLCRDRVEYRVPGGALIERLFVRSDLEKIFSYRNQQIQEHFQQKNVEPVPVG